MSEAPTLRERTRDLMRAEIQQTALRLFVERGFDETTVGDVVAAVGLSRRSFFRYFTCKEDVVVGFLDEVGDHIAAALAARPGGEPPWEALRRCLDAYIAGVEADRPRALVLYRLVHRTPSLRARNLDKQDRWHGGATRQLARRMGVDPRADMRPAVLTAAALCALQVAHGSWVAAQGEASLAELTDEAFAVLTPTA